MGDACHLNDRRETAKWKCATVSAGHLQIVKFFRRISSVFAIFVNNKTNSGTSTNKNEIKYTAISIKFLFQIIFRNTSVQVGYFYPVSLESRIISVMMS